MEDTPLMVVSLGDEFKVYSKQKCSVLELDIQGNSFEAKVMALPLEGIDIILGVQWLKSVNRVSFDFIEMQLTGHIVGQHLKLQGLDTNVKREIRLMSQLSSRK